MLIRGFQFCLNYWVALVSTFLLLILIGRLSGLSTGYASLAVLPLLIVSMIEGKRFARVRRARPGHKQSLAASLQMMVLAAGIAGLFLILGRHLMPGQIARLDLPEIDNAWFALAGVVCGTVAILRMGYAFGLATELKGQQVSG